MNYLKKMSFVIFNVQYVFLTGKLRDKHQADGLKLYVAFFFPQYYRVFNVEKNTLLGKISDVVIQLNSEKVIKVMKFLCDFVILCKEIKFPGYTLGYYIPEC